MDFSEDTAEEERKAIAAYPYKRGMKRDGDDDLAALMAEIESSIAPIHVLDPFTYWVQRVVGEAVFGRDIMEPINKKSDNAAVVADKEMYGKALAGSQSLRGLEPLACCPDLVRDAEVLMTTSNGIAYFYPAQSAYAAVSGDELAAVEFLHIQAHMRAYLVDSIVQSCSPTGVEEEYLNKSYVELWEWLVGSSRVALPISEWTADARPFVALTRDLYHIHCTALELI